MCVNSALLATPSGESAVLLFQARGKMAARASRTLRASLSLSLFVQLDETQTLTGKTVLEKVGAREGCTGVYNEGHMSAAGRQFLE